MGKDKLLERRAELETARQQVADEFQRLTGAIQLIDALLAEIKDDTSIQENNNDS